MNLKKFIGAILVGLIFFSDVASAYDLPKLKVEKTAEKSNSILKSDWQNLEVFLARLKILSAQGLSPSAKERVYIDKNNIFIAQYKDNFYFLDRYSIKVRKDLSDRRVWQQKIFALGKNVVAKNTEAVKQTFYTDGKNFYNSSKKKNDLTLVENEDDKKFLTECFKVGYYYAYGEEIFIEGDDTDD